MADQKILDRIKKLLNLAGDASAGEAETAGARAAQMMLEHGISLAQVADASRDNVVNISIGARTVTTRFRWDSALLNHVARASGGLTVLCNQGRPGQYVRLFAPDEVCDSIIATYEYLRVQVTLECSKVFRAERPDRPQAWKRAFFWGAVGRLGERLGGFRAEAAASSGTSTALVRLDNSVRTRMQEEFPRLGKGKMVRISNGNGAFHGRQAAGRMDLGGRSIAPPARRMLGGA